MEDKFFWFGMAVLFVLVAYTLYLNVLATMVIRYSARLNRFQRIAQSIIVWSFPLLGSGFVLHLLYLDAPKVMPRAWIPWPFKKMIYGKPIKPNKNRSTVRVSTYGHR